MFELKHRMYKLLVAVMVFGILLTSTATFAASVENPLYVSLQLERNDAGKYDRFSMEWKNPEWVKAKLDAGEAVDFEIDARVNGEAWSSESGTVYRSALTKDQSEEVKLTIPPEAFSSFGRVDIENNLYSFRVRYVSGNAVSPYTNAIAVGFRPGFSNASEWSKEELASAGKHGFIPPSIKSDMKREITREEFTEVIVRVYEKVNRVHLVAGESPYRDTKNDAVTVATRLGIVYGVGHGAFDPDAQITRQDMATIFNRLLGVLEIRGDDVNSVPFADHDKLSDYAIRPAYQLQSLGIMKGYKDNTFRPETKASREQGVALAERTYRYIERMK